MTRADARRLKLTRSIEEAHALADAVLVRARAAKARTAPKRSKGVKEKRQRREERSVYVAALRGAALARSGERCEFCRGVLDATWELHHILSGGERRTEERPETCAAVCRYCHRQYHAGDVSTLRNAKEWAIRHGLRDALRAIDHRLAKIKRTREVPVRLVIEESRT